MLTPLSGFAMAALLSQLGAGQWFIAASDLGAILSSDVASVTVLDARSSRDYARGHVSGAVRIDWKDYRSGWGRVGTLTPDVDALAQKLAALGVHAERPVIVYGNAGEGWGEEGRIAWMLHYLGHPNVRVLNGGYASWTQAGGAVDRTKAAPRNGAFSASINPTVRTSLADVAAAVGIRQHGAASARARAIVLDVRPRDEWDGARRYWEPRVGHIPGAVRFDWRHLLDESGRLRSRDALLPALAAIGVTPDRTVLVYCTGGVRSAQAFWMLRALGFSDVRNYDGSWYEWAFDRSVPVAVGGSDTGDGR